MVSEMTVDTVTALRARSFGPADIGLIPAFNIDHPVNSPGKQPLGVQWQLDARMNPPFCSAHLVDKI